MNEFDRRKKEVGMAPAGSSQYFQNAAHILGANPNNPDARRKLNDLAGSRDPKVREAARRALHPDADDSDDPDD